MPGNRKRADYEAMGDAIARAVAPAIAQALTPQFVELRSEISTLRSQINARLDQTNMRLDQIVENTGSHYRRLEERVSRIESKVFPEKS